MKKYKIDIQFADPKAPDLDSVMPVIDRAISNYNTRSLLAKNPKKITEKVVVDPRTLRLTLESDSELPFPGKALRLFSAYLVDPNTEGALTEHIYGKQLFKMSSVEIDEEAKSEPEVGSDAKIDAMRIRAISLIISVSENTLRGVIDLLVGEVAR